MKVVIITPARNEESYIGKTIGCMIRQTMRPLKWIIVDDGSSDRTGEIVKESRRTAPFITYMRLPDRGYRKPGEGVINAFYEGLGRVANMDYDVVAKLDADLVFPENTLETICLAFESDPSLGITGGTQYEQVNRKKGFSRVLTSKGFVLGPQKFYRRNCFKDINGLVRRAGWDGVDTIRANIRGWKTGQIESLKIFHLKPTGTAEGEGIAKACKKYGDVSYYMGGFLWYFLLRAIARSLENHDPRVGYYMISGYLTSWRKKEERESQEFRFFLKRNQLRNMREFLQVALRRFC